MHESTRKPHEISKLIKTNRDLKSSLVKTCTHRKSSTFAGIASSSSSQEPRRPRFSFFSLHYVKELTKAPSPATIVIGEHRLHNLRGNMVPLRLPGRSCRPYRLRRTVGAASAQRRQRGPGFRQHIRCCQHPIFDFRQNRISNTETANCFLFSVACFVLAAVWRRALQR